MSTNLECQLRSSTVDDGRCECQRSYQIRKAICRQRTGWRTRLRVKTYDVLGVEDEF